nr:12612_t:CDS:10 [Entrophospora candida]
MDIVVGGAGVFFLTSSKPNSKARREAEKYLLEKSDKHNEKEEVIAAKKMLKDSEYYISIVENMNKEEIQLLNLETGKKALSASTLTKFLREEEFKEIPKYILLKAAERGKIFHKAVQDFIRTGKHPLFVDSEVVDKLSKVEQKIHETINFLKKNDPLKLNGFLGNEKLHYVFYKGELLATYLDLEFHDYIVELKTRVVLNHFQVSDYSLKILDVLIEFARNNDSYSPAIKKADGICLGEYEKQNVGKKREEVTELDINNKELEGKLDLSGFKNLKKLNCSYNKLTSLNIVDSNNSLEELVANDNQLSQLTWNFKTPTNLKSLDIRNSGIRLSLMGDISYINKIFRENDADKCDFVNLEKLDCSDNELAKIILKNNKKLVSLYCKNNKLTSLDLSGCENLEVLIADNGEHGSFNELSDTSFLEKLPKEKLKVLHLAVNNIKSDLKPFSRFINLENLDLGMSGYSKEVTEKRGNKLSGSLEPLKNLTKLKRLFISNTDIEGDIKDLLNNIEEIYCSSEERLESKVENIAEQLREDSRFILEGNRYVKKQTIQESFDKSYLNKEEVKEIDLSELVFTEEGELKIENNRELNLNDCPKLTKIDCYYNQLEEFSIKNCPKLEEVDFSYNKLKEIKINLKELPNLKKLDCSDNKLADLGLSSEKLKYLEEINISNNDGLSELDGKLKKDNSFLFHNNKYVKKQDAQKWLDENFPEDGVSKFPGCEDLERSKIKKLDISERGLVGELNLDGFVSLEELDCGSNELKKLDVDNCLELKIISCLENQLTNLDLSNLSQLEEITCRDNLLTDIKYPSDFKKLTGLSIRKKLTKLESIHISNTDVNEVDIKSLSENLPNLKEIQCSVEERPSSKLKEIKEELDLYQKKIDKSNTKKRLNEMYPDKSAKVLDYLYSESLRGSLDLSEYKDLEVLDCHDNELTSIDISKNNKLKKLDISDTDISFGLEQFPDSLEEIICSFKGERKVKELAKQLEPYAKRLDKDYPKENRRKETNLDISKKKLAWKLKLEVFTSLESLNCSENKLTSLDLNDCPKLTKIDCSNNSFTDLGFLRLGNKSVGKERKEGFDYKKLKKLAISNNKFSSQSLEQLKNFTELTELDISGCNFEGSLEPLGSLTKLEEINISNTNIERGLEYLPDSCKKLYCNRKLKCRSAKLVKELGKYLKGNISKFHDKWGEKGENGLSRLSNLQTPEQFTLNDDYNQIGGAIGIVSTATETVTSLIKENLYENKKKDLDELVGLLKPLQITKLEDGKVNGKLKELSGDIYHFFSMYDIDGDGEIDHTELKQVEDFLKKNDFKLDYNLDKRIKKLKKIEELKEFAECFQNKKEKLERITQEIKEGLKEEAEDIAEKKDISETMSNQIENSALSSNWLKKPMFATIFGEKGEKDALSANLELVKDEELNNEETGKQEVSINVHQDLQEQSSTQNQIEQPPK